MSGPIFKKRKDHLIDLTQFLSHLIDLGLVSTMDIFYIVDMWTDV